MLKPNSKSSMVLTGHQPNYLPYLGFFHKIAHSDIFALVDNTQYVKRGKFGWINRNRIRTKDGWMWLTVPVLVKGKYDQIISDVKINNDLNWGRKHLNALIYNYQKAPYFKKYILFFQGIYKRRWGSLNNLNETIIRYLIKTLGIKVKIVKSSSMKIKGKGQGLIVNMCRAQGVDTYLSGIHGRDYINEKKMPKDIRVIYQKFTHPKYNQQFPGFIEGLSVVDLLFNYGPKSLDLILSRGQG